MNLLICEILDKVSKLKTKKEKVAWLKTHDSDGLRMVIKSSFDPELKWLLPDGDVPSIVTMHQREQNTQTCTWRQENCITLSKVVTMISHKLNVKLYSFKC